MLALDRNKWGSTPTIPRDLPMPAIHPATPCASSSIRWRLMHALVIFHMGFAQPRPVAGFESVEQSLWQETCNDRTKRFPKEAQGRDIRDDQALSGLQTATHKKVAHRYRAVPLREACLARIVVSRRQSRASRRVMRDDSRAIARYANRKLKREARAFPFSLSGSIVKSSSVTFASSTA